MSFLGTWFRYGSACAESASLLVLCNCFRNNVLYVFSVPERFQIVAPLHTF